MRLRKLDRKEMSVSQLIERTEPIGKCINCRMDLHYVGEPDAPGLDKYIHADPMQSMYCDPT